ncbi:MAG: hypothetical protein Q8918_03715 [Bacteroidota bacterium]|nr:hypothetical protein [Bacteroidota bacterium]MDP4211064.1 hypothetical protein [Bacteroidota bacterium]MDP4249201.1 hypothetical protein [Bacteroidota bacterium]
MFRNLIGGNRELYLVQSGDGGKTFAPAEKLGTGSWKLNGCPMDGGALVINENGILQTVWRPKDKIFACEPGKPELEIADGRSCSMTVAGTKNVYVWTEKGDVICGFSSEKKQNLGKGNLPVVKATGDHEQVICVWENDRQLHSALLNL